MARGGPRELRSPSYLRRGRAGKSSECATPRTRSTNPDGTLNTQILHPYQQPCGSVRHSTRRILTCFSGELCLPRQAVRYNRNCFLTCSTTSRRTTHELFPLLSYNHHQRRLAHPTGGATKRKLNSPVTYPSRPDWRARDPRPHTSALHTRTCPSRPTAFFFLSTRATHAHQLQPAALAFVSYGFVLVRVRGGGRVWALPGPMPVSHAPLAFARGSGLVATHRGRLGGFCSAEFELDSALEETRKQRGCVCFVCRRGPFLDPTEAHIGLPRPPGLRPRQRLGCGASRASRGLLFGRV